MAFDTLVAFPVLLAMPVAGGKSEHVLPAKRRLEDEFQSKVKGQKVKSSIIC